MCGFTGFYANKHISSEVLLKMNAAIKHRGPDDEGYFLDGRHFSGNDSRQDVKAAYPSLENSPAASLGVGFRRLSIIDLSVKGHQPMSSEKGSCITFNGEIYNFTELRAELVREGAVFYSHSDTEVILKGYEHWGTEVVKKLDGMFSFCILDQEKSKLIFARDRWGLKPLFYFKNEEGFFWASEIKALLKSGKIQPKINWEGVQSNFMYQTTISPHTCFQGIFSLEPAHFATYDLKTGEFNTEEFYRLPSDTDKTLDTETAAIKIEKLLQESIERQLYADVPVISMMSGGIDSTLVTAMAKKIDKNLEAFTLSYENADEEVENAKLVARENEVAHCIEPIDSQKVLQDIRENIAFFEEPYPAVEVLVNASEFGKSRGYKVILSGNGADEVFGGYGHLMKFDRWKKMRKLRFLRHFAFGKGNFSKKVKNYFSQDSVEDFFRNGQSGMKPFELKELFLHPVKINSGKQTKNGYQQYFLEDMMKSLASHHAYRDDLSAMKNSLEFRYPYLSNDLVDFVARLPEEIRFNGMVNKPLLREIAEKYLPKEVMAMRKRGFTFPAFGWFQKDRFFRDFVFENLESLKKREIFRTETVDRWAANIHSPADLGKIWQLVTFEIWMQTYFDSNEFAEEGLLFV